MAEYLSPGVYVEEVETGAMPIEGVGTSTAGFLGETERGPTDPEFITSFSDFRRKFGGVVENQYLTHGVEGFFRNGGQRCYVGRIISGSATAATAALQRRGENEANGDDGAIEPGEEIRLGGEVQAWKGQAPDQIAGEDNPTLVLHVDGSYEITWENLDGEEHNLEIVDEDDEVVDDYRTDSVTELGETEKLEVDKVTDEMAEYVCRSHEDTMRGEIQVESAILQVAAVGPGSWGDNVAVIVDQAGSGDEDRFKLIVKYWTEITDTENDTDENGNSGENSSGTDGENGNNQNDSKTPVEKEIDARGTPDVEEIYDDLSPEKADSDYYEKVVNGTSALIEVERKGQGRPPDGTFTLSDGSDGDDVGLGDFEGEDKPGEKTGFEAFKEKDDISIVCVPDEHSYNESLTGKIREHCEGLEDRIAVLQADRNSDQRKLPSGHTLSDKGYAALYYPWIRVMDPETNMPTPVPPGGHVAGVYARSDGQRGVHKAPANETVRGARELEVDVTKGEQDLLNPKGVNCIRSFRGRGIRIWGARTTSSNPLWKYVNVRRLFIYLRGSIDRGTQWVVFEPNDEKLWARVEQSVGNFLTDVWRNGALMGTTPEEAFYVKCDRSTMSQNDIDTGKLIVEIGVAPVKPAEFVIFRITQWTGGAEGA